MFAAPSKNRKSSSASHRKPSQPGRSAFAPNAATVQLSHLIRNAGMQPKLKVSQPNDRYEREADGMADKVMTSPDPAAVRTPRISAVGSAPLQRQEDKQEEVQPQTQPVKEEEPTVQRKEKVEEDKVQPQPVKEEEETVQRKEHPEEEQVQTKPAGEEEESVQRKEKIEEDKVQPQPVKEEEETVQRKEHPEEEQVQTRPVGAEEDKIQKSSVQEKPPEQEDQLQRKGVAAAPAVGAGTLSSIQNRTGGGQPLPSATRSYMEPRFSADFGNVRIHNDAESAAMSENLSARAFTYRNHIFFSRDQYQPGTSEGKRLLAHELTHTIQQGHAAMRSPQTSRAASPPQVQRFSLDPIAYLYDKAVTYIADHAAEVPGFTMLTVVIGYNPITRSRVERNAGNILNGAIRMIPVAGPLIAQALENHGIFGKASVFVSQQFKALKDIASNVWSDIKQFVKKFSITDLRHPGEVWNKAKKIVTTPIDKIKAFAIGLKDTIVKFIKDAILKPIAAFAKAHAPNGYALLSAVLGKDPISGEVVPPTAENLIGPFMALIGQEDVWQNMKKANAVNRAWAWFKGALSTVKSAVQQIPTLFITAFRSLEIIDIIFLSKAFNKLRGVFGGFVGKFVSWAGGAVWKLLEIIFDSVKPGLMGYIKRTGAALKSILKNPIPFVGNLVRAAKLGFSNFAAHIGKHLKAGLIDWLTGSLEGVYIPKALSLMEIGKFALSVLGITWAQIRAKIVKALGPRGETIMKGLETGFEIIKKLITGGPAAAWELIKEKLTDLKDAVVSGIISFVTETIVMKAIPKLISMFIPGAGFISAIISIYDTIMVFVQKISKIAQVVSAFINSIVTIAAGNIGAAAKRVESVLAGLLSLAISFLAGFLGLGKVTDKIMGVIQKVRKTVDKAIDTAINWIVKKAKALFGKLFGKGQKDERTEEQKNKDKLAAIAAAEKLLSDQDFDEDTVRGELGSIKKRYKLLELNLVVDSKEDQTETVHFTAAASSKVSGQKKKVKLKPRYKVGTHTVTDPKLKGESHHVPVKVMKMWFGEVLENASKKADDKDLRQRLSAQANVCKGNPEGEGLSAILLSEKDHVTVHGTKPTMTIPVITTSKGEVSTKPTRATIRRNVPAPFKLKEKNPDTKQLRRTFNSVFNQLLQVGLATVAALSLKGGWRGKLKSIAGSTWAPYKKVPHKKK